MNIRKYFWDLNDKAVKETRDILRNPRHRKFMTRILALLTRCDQPKELFSLISREQFAEIWPKVRNYWKKTSQAPDFRAWWETVYEHLAKSQGYVKGEPMEEFKKIGDTIKNARVEKGWTQNELARRTKVSQPDVSAIESGRKNITLETLVRVCRILGIAQIPIGTV